MEIWRKIKPFFHNFETTFWKEFCTNFFFNIFCAKLKDVTLKSNWKSNNSVKPVLYKLLIYFKVHLWPNYTFVFKILRSKFKNSFVWTFFYVLCAKLKYRTHQTYWKPRASVLFLHHKFIKLLSVFWHFCCFEA